MRVTSVLGVCCCWPAWRGFSMSGRAKVTARPRGCSLEAASQGWGRPGTEWTPPHTHTPHAHPHSPGCSGQRSHHCQWSPARGHNRLNVHMCVVTEKKGPLRFMGYFSPLTASSWFYVHLTMTMYTSMVLIGGWGRRSPFSSRSGMSLVEIPSYGFPPKVISSQMVTPKKTNVKQKTM